MIKKSHSIALLGFLLALIIYYIIEHISEFRIILNISPGFCLAIVILYLVFLISNGIFFKIIISDFGIKMGCLEYTAISIITSFGNAFIPLRGGAGIRAIYMKSKYGFNYTDSLATIAGTYVIGFNVTSIMLLFTLLAIYITQDYFNIPITCMVVALVFASSYIILFNPNAHRLILLEWLKNKLDKIICGWSTIRKSPMNIFHMYSLTLFNFLLVSLITWLEFMALGIKDMSGNPVTFMQSFFLSVISIISLFIGITPASLGVREGLLMLTSNIVKISPSHVLMMSILDRAISFSVLLLLFHVATYYLKVCLRTKDSDGSPPQALDPADDQNL